jgi:DNA-binding response OmpR family regulator
MLRGAGFDVVESEDGAGALSIAMNGKVDALVLDVDLPDIDGFEVLAQLRRNKKTWSIPVVLVSAVFTKEDEVRQGLRGGADAYMSLPLDSAQLSKILRRLLELPEENPSSRKNQ